MHYFFVVWAVTSLFAFSPQKLLQNCLILQKHYPDAIARCESEQLVLKDNRKIAFYNPSLKRDIDSMMQNPDLYAVFYYSYDKNKISDAGRVRLYPLLELTYGKDQKTIEKNLIPVHFVGQRVLFNKQNQAAEALKKVSTECEKLLKQKPHWAIYFQNVSTYYYRKIAGTELLSSHSFGIAIDLNPHYARYWRWDNKNQKNTIKNKQYPQEIVAIFEKYGFIWGGRWEHYDTMHFEYRPEFLN